MYKNASKDLGFEYGKITDIFSKEMNIYNEGMMNFKKVKKVIDIILASELRPDIIFGQEDCTLDRYKELLVCFLKYFKEEYGSYEISKWRYTIDTEAMQEVKAMLSNVLENEYGLLIKEQHIYKHDVNPNYDTSYMIPFIIHQAINHKPWEKAKVIDELGEAENLTNAIFFGDRGLLNWEGLKKPSYYSYYFLSQLGDAVVAQGDGYIVTSKGEDFQVLLYTYNEDINKLQGHRDVTERNISLNITNLWRDYRVIKYEIDEQVSSCYGQWKAMGQPHLLKDEEMELLKLASMPRITLSFRKKKPILHMNVKIKGGAVLILFKA